MRFFAIIAACIGFASALSLAPPVGFGGPGSGDVPVTILKSPIVAEDHVGGEGPPGVQPKFGGGYPVQSGAQANANAYANAGPGGYQPGVVAGLGGRYQGQSGAQANANAYANAGPGGYQPGVVAGLGGENPGQGGAQANAIATAGVRDYQQGLQPGFGGVYPGQAGAGAGAFANAGGAGATSNANAEVKVIYNPPEDVKHFYYLEAPSEKTKDKADTLVITKRRHYKLIFIKAPSNSADSEAISKAASQTEDKTIVYVLVNNKSKVNTLSNASAESFTSGKPEVYFVKYGDKTPRSGPGAIAIANAIANAQSGDGTSIANADANAGYNDQARPYTNSNTNADVGFGNPVYRYDGKGISGAAFAGATAGASAGSSGSGFPRNF